MLAHALPKAALWDAPRGASQSLPRLFLPLGGRAEGRNSCWEFPNGKLPAGGRGDAQYLHLPSPPRLFPLGGSRMRKKNPHLDPPLNISYKSQKNHFSVL